MEALFNAYNVTLQPKNMWEADKILDLTSVTNANKKLYSSNKKEIKKVTPVKIKDDQQHDSEIKRILEAARTMPFKFNRNTSKATTYRGPEKSDSSVIDTTTSNQNIINLNNKLCDAK